MILNLVLHQLFTTFLAALWLQIVVWVGWAGLLVPVPQILGHASCLERTYLPDLCVFFFSLTTAEKSLSLRFIINNVPWC